MRISKVFSLFIKIITILYSITLATISLHAIYCEKLSPYLDKIIIQTIAPVLACIGIYFTANLALKKYHEEQRTTRIKELYFDNTLLGLTNSLEKTQGDTSNNIFLVENLIEEIFFTLEFHYNNNHQLVDEEHKIKKALIEKVDRVINHIEYNIDPTDFKKATIACLLKEIDPSASISLWMVQFEKDMSKFNLFLKSSLSLLKSDILTINESSIGAIRENIINLHKKNVHLIQRHYFLLNGLSSIILELSSLNFSTVDNIKQAFRGNKISTIINEINNAYNKLIVDFSSASIGFISNEDAELLQTDMKLLRKQNASQPKGKYGKLYYLLKAFVNRATRQNTAHTPIFNIDE